MLPHRVSNPGPLTYKSDALPIALHGLAMTTVIYGYKVWQSSREDEVFGDNLGYFF